MLGKKDSSLLSSSQLPSMCYHLNTQCLTPESTQFVFFLTLFPSFLLHDGKLAAKWSHHNQRQEEMICLSPFEVERVNIKPAVEHPVLLTHHWFLTSLLLSDYFL